MATNEAVTRTRPTARSVMERRRALRSSGEKEKASEFKSGGKKMRKMTSGETTIVGSPGVKPMASPPRTRKTG